MQGGGVVLLGISAATAAFSCGGSDHSSASVKVLDGLVSAGITINGSYYDQVIVDTGAPITLLASSQDAAHTIPVGQATLDRVDFGGMTFHQVPIVGTDQLQGGGLIGCTLFCKLVLSFDYRDQQILLGSLPMPMGVDPMTAIPFDLKGGGVADLSDGSKLTIPPSRVRVSVDVEGQTHTMFVDTGAEYVALRTSIFDRLTADGRGTVQQRVFTLNATTGAAGTLARLRHVTLDGLDVQRIVGLGDPAVDQLLDVASKEAGETIDGLLGASYLREFNVTIDYPGRTLHLARYQTRDHIIDYMSRVGVEITQTNLHITVAMVHPNTDAAKQGVQEGDVITAIDGETTFFGSTGLLDALNRLSGTPGSTRTIIFGCNGCGGFQGTKTLAVEDLLPLP